MSEAPEGDQSAITKAEIHNWVQGNFANYAEDYLWEILSGKYDLAQARQDVLSFRDDPNEPLLYDEPEHI